MYHDKIWQAFQDIEGKRDKSVSAVYLLWRKQVANSEVKKQWVCHHPYARYNIEYFGWGFYA